MILAISSKINGKLTLEYEIENWKEAGLLKPSIFKASIVTIEKDFVLTKLGSLKELDRVNLDKMLKIIC